jgi:AcrR family transcriptional regulator
MTSTATKITDKRAAILETTLDLIALRGFHNTPMSVVAKESGVSAGIIYHYFENKDQLIVELYKEIKANFFRALLDGFDESAPYKKRFTDTWQNIAKFYLGHPKEVQFLEQYEHSPYYDPYWQETYAEEIAPLMTVFIQGVAEVVLKDLPVAVLLELGTSSAVSLAKQHIRGILELNEELIVLAAEAAWDAIAK